MLIVSHCGARKTRVTWPRTVALSILSGLAWLSVSPVAVAQINFQNVTPTALEGFVTESWGGAWGDYNGDFWPDMIIPNHRERPSVYKNNGDGTFTNVILQADTSKTWISNRTADHHGVALADFDGDGDDDVFTITNGCCPSQLQVSYGETFVDETTSRGLPGVAGSSTQWMDWDRDGNLDIINGDRVYLQDSSNNFPSSTFIGGCGRTYWTILTDVNNDGVQDFVCTNEGNFPKKVYDISGATPTDITADFPTVGNVVDSAARDFDNDGDIDHVFVRGTTIVNQVKQFSSTKVEANLDTSPNQVTNAGEQTGFRVTGGGVLTLKLNKATWFTNVEVYVGANGTNYPFGSDITLTLDPNDTDTHGLPATTTGREIYVGYDPAIDEWTIIQGDGFSWWLVYAQLESTTAMSNVTPMGLRDVDFPMRARVMMNEPSGFVNRTFEKGLNQDIYKCNSVAAEDFDNDMDVDLFFACTDGVENLSNRVFANNGNGVFTEISGGAGGGGVTGPAIASSAGTGEIALTADYDNDGFVDVFVANGVNTQPVRVGGPHELFRNTGNSNNWISVELTGTASNAAGIGATIRATTGGVTQMREYGGTYHRWSQDYKRAHFGLAGNTSVDIEVTWPNGTVESFAGQGVNSIYLITEGTGIAAVSPGAVTGFATPIPGDECGAPSYNNQLDQAAFIYRDCAAGRWSFRSTAGGSSSLITYAGSLGTNQTYSNVTGVSIEGGDVLAAGAATIGFDLQMSGFGFDGFDFDVTAGADNCLDITLPGSARLLVGPNHLPVTPPIDLTTMASCTPAATPTFDIQALSVDESVGTANVVVTLNPPLSSGSATIKFSTISGGSATPGSDYYGTFKVLTFAPGETSKTASVTIVDDTNIEPSETVNVRIFGAAGAAIGNATTAITVADNDTGVATLSVQSLTVSEADGTADVTVALSASQSTPVTVGFATSNGGSATPGSDYYGKYQLVTFSPGSTSESVSVTIVNDSTAESTETINVRIFNPSGAVINASTGVITVNDDD